MNVLFQYLEYGRARDMVPNEERSFPLLYPLCLMPYVLFLIPYFFSLIPYPLSLIPCQPSDLEFFVHYQQQTGNIRQQCVFVQKVFDIRNAYKVRFCFGSDQVAIFRDTVYTRLFAFAYASVTALRACVRGRCGSLEETT